PAGAGTRRGAPALAGISSRQRTVAATCVPGAAGSGSAPWTYLRPRSSDATAATRQATIAKSNAMASPLENGAEISDGKKVWPVREAAWLGGRLSTVVPSSAWVGV